MGKVDYTSFSDGDLVKRYLAGDERSFGELFTRYNSTILSRVRRRLGDDVLANDAMQDAWYKALRSLQSYDQKWHFGPWLSKIADNHVSSLRMKASNRYELTMNRFSEEHERRFYQLSHSSPKGEFQAERDMRLHSLETAVADAISALPAYQAEVIVFCDIDGLSPTEVGKMINANPVTIRTRLNRARNAIKQSIPDYIAELRVA